MLTDKPVEKVVQALPAARLWKLAGLDCHRGLDAAGLEQRFQAVAVDGVDRTVAVYPTVNAALKHLQQTALADEHWLVVGSFYTVEQALTLIYAQQKSGEYAWKSI